MKEYVGVEGVRRTMGVRKVMLQREFSMKKSLQMPGLPIFFAYHMLHFKNTWLNLQVPEISIHVTGVSLTQDS